MATKKYKKRAREIEKKQTDYERGVADGRRAMRSEIAGLAADVGLALLRAFVTRPSTPSRTDASPHPPTAHASTPAAGVAIGQRPSERRGFYDPRWCEAPDASASKRPGDRSG